MLMCTLNVWFLFLYSSPEGVAIGSKKTMIERISNESLIYA